MHDETNSPRSWVRAQLPWLVAGGALLFFLFTLHRTVTYFGLPMLARTAGWDWRPAYAQPLHVFLTHPINWLSPGWQPLGLNFLAVLCASLTLALLARSVALLPHDRTRDQRLRERSDYSYLTMRLAWVPPLFAVLACGLQRTFWEHAVAYTGEMLDLLLFAYVIRCLLEFRVNRKEVWLSKLALGYGLAASNNYAMFAFFPLFLAALVWIKGLEFFQFRFLLQMLLFGLAGFAVYFALPLIQSFSNLSTLSFWAAFKAVAGVQWLTLKAVPRYLILVFSFTSVLPVVLMGIRWKASLGDISAAGNFLTNVLTHLMHIGFLAAGAWLAFDPLFSPRAKGGYLTFLPLYYLSALTVGYCSGYCLLVFGTDPEQVWQRAAGLKRALHRGIAGLVLVGLVAVPAGLIHKNLPPALAAKGTELEHLAARLKEALPPRAIVLSDDLYRLWLLAYEVNRAGTGANYALVDTSSLNQAAYYVFLNRKYPQYCPPLDPSYAITATFNSAIVLDSLANVGRTNEVYYLHPSFGYYFERFYLEPHGLVYKLRELDTNSVAPPLPTPAAVAAADTYWNKLETGEFSTLAARLKKGSEPAPGPNVVLAGAKYSTALNHWGVELQKAGQLDKAADYFGRALRLNPDNPSAYINQTFNKKLHNPEFVRQMRTGETNGIELTPEIINLLTPYNRDLFAILRGNGPIDELGSYIVMTPQFAAGRIFLQAAQFLARARTFQPKNFRAGVMQARFYTQAERYDQSLQLVSELRGWPGLSVTNQLELTLTEAGVYYSRKQLPEAERLLLSAQAQHPKEPAPFAELVNIYLDSADSFYGKSLINQTSNQTYHPLYLARLTNIIEVLQRQLILQPQDFNAMVSLGGTLMRLEPPQYELALPHLNRALELFRDNSFALYYRALANFKTGRLKEARQDFDILNSKTPDVFQYKLALAYIADTNRISKDAIKYYQEYLKTAPTTYLQERSNVVVRLKELKRRS